LQSQWSVARGQWSVKLETYDKLLALEAVTHDFLQVRHSRRRPEQRREKDMGDHITSMLLETLSLAALALVIGLAIRWLLRKK